eukprot:TRINITY_DN67309_c11_g3_i1.p1 TRINITY_DN67309_c11_g3~~TRINITY_DN67309_c11_g3_i1.p1  ORF type:complete len:334 (-),score=25.87 TRINITY_DN67309_c11_g3_i1:163-1164(-)
MGLRKIYLFETKKYYAGKTEHKILDPEELLGAWLALLDKWLCSKGLSKRGPWAGLRCEYWTCHKEHTKEVEKKEIDPTLFVLKHVGQAGKYVMLDKGPEGAIVMEDEPEAGPEAAATGLDRRPDESFGFLRILHQISPLQKKGEVRISNGWVYENSDFCVRVGKVTFLGPVAVVLELEYKAVSAVALLAWHRQDRRHTDDVFVEWFSDLPTELNELPKTERQPAQLMGPEPTSQTPDAVQELIAVYNKYGLDTSHGHLHAAADLILLLREPIFGLGRLLAAPAKRQNPAAAQQARQQQLQQQQAAQAARQHAAQQMHAQAQQAHAHQHQRPMQ